MKTTRFIVGFLSVLASPFLAWLFLLCLKGYCPMLVRIVLPVFSLWLFSSGTYLLIQGRSPLSTKGKIIFELNIIGWLLFALVVIAIPNFVKARSTSAADPCGNNLRQIDAAANQFALEHNLTNGAPINFPNDLTPYIKLNSAGKIPPCPAGGIYSIKKVGEFPTCSFGSTVTRGHVLQ
jgi:hypothetical protein